GELSTDPDSAPNWIKSLGFGKISVLHTRDPKVADTDKFIEPLKTATAIWFSGGRQWRTMDVYLGTKA
ncbi:MAG: peptidase S51, partial [Verrucomicrobiae bacterium]|nr:peptidase S51 [Verrucomicrobiae bacterium]